MCRVLKLNRSGFYAWLKKPLSNRAIEDARLLKRIKAFFIASGGTYGSPGSTKTYVKPVKNAVCIVLLRSCASISSELKSAISAGISKSVSLAGWQTMS